MKPPVYEDVDPRSLRLPWSRHDGADSVKLARQIGGGFRMSMGMMVYLVDEAEVKAVPGSNDADLLEELLDREGQHESLSWYDEELADLMEEWSPGFTHADALRDIFAGRVTRPDSGFVYQNAFEHVCSSL